MSRHSFKRTARVSSLVRQALAEIISTEVKDPRVRQITLTDVEVSGDLREARVYFCHHGDADDEAAILEGLARASGYLRRQLGTKIRVRTTPTLDFRVDTSLDYGASIERVFRDIKLQEGDSTDADDSPDDGDETA
tara:strand:- start:156 stop:563 length:408 start_codon:yes stop_codon:yes gene_type:complete